VLGRQIRRLELDERKRSARGGRRRRSLPPRPTTGMRPATAVETQAETRPESAEDPRWRHKRRKRRNRVVRLN